MLSLGKRGIMNEVIRPATLDDVEGVKELVIKFYDESLSEYKISLDMDTIKETISNFIKNHIVIVLEKQDKLVGVIGGLVTPSIFDKNQFVAQEFVWYIDKQYRHGFAGIKLLKLFEKECKNRGANLINMIHMNNLYTESLHDFYTKNGYYKMEIHYMKGV